MTHTSDMEIVAHRGVSLEFPENTLPAFQRAVDLGADAVECDVRLTADRVPVVFHWLYLEVLTNHSGPIFGRTYEQLKHVRFSGANAKEIGIPTLRQVMETIGGQAGLEIHIQGPEPESAPLIANVLADFKDLWDTIEVTSYEPALLLSLQQRCLGLATDLLFPRSEPWMRPDVVTYLAIQRARLARARAVHLHPTQLVAESVSEIRQRGVEVHAWDVNDERAFETAASLKIPRICTDRLSQALAYRKGMRNGAQPQ